MSARLKAVVMDVDGTLYRQQPVRLRMALRLMRHFAVHPSEGIRVMRTIRTYRHAQERLRCLDGAGRASRQMALTAEITGYESDWVRRVVELWMEEIPLDFVGEARFAGVLEFCAWAHERNVALAVLSDYDPRAKLARLSLDAFIDLSGWAQEWDIGVFKPDPKGLLTVLRRLGVEAGNSVYIGDRIDVDGETAIAAGVDGYILTKKQELPNGLRAFRNWTALRSELAARIES